MPIKQTDETKIKLPLIMIPTRSVDLLNPDDVNACMQEAILPIFWKAYDDATRLLGCPPTSCILSGTIKKLVIEATNTRNTELRANVDARILQAKILRDQLQAQRDELWGEDNDRVLTTDEGTLLASIEQKLSDAYETVSTLHAERNTIADRMATYDNTGTFANGLKYYTSCVTESTHVTFVVVRDTTIVE